ncbi:MAG TPA: DUF5107 domain-containing protein [Tepidisphaeraceae bacterium]|jgi:hypothetical protein
MSQPVTIENEHLKLAVWPQFGGKIASAIDKADGFELLYNIPEELPTRCQYDMAYDMAFSSGWDECFPAVAAGPYPLHPYQGVPVPDHGELWPLPTTAVPTLNGITTVWHGLRFGYRLTRKLYLDGPTIRAEYTLINLAPFDFRFLWSPSLLLSTLSPIELNLSDAPMAGGFLWPQIDAGTRFTTFDALPPGQSWSLLSDAPLSTPAGVRYPARGRRLLIAYDSADSVAAWWAVLLDTGLLAGSRYVSVAPITARAESIKEAVDLDTAATVKASGRITWSMQLAVEADG